MSDPSFSGAEVRINPNGSYPTTGGCEEGHDCAMEFSGAELLRLEAGEQVDGFSLKKRANSTFIYGRCQAQENGGPCNHTVRLDYPQTHTEADLSGWRTCTVCLHLLERPGAQRLLFGEHIGAIDDSGRRTTGRPPADFCWCGEKSEHVPTTW